MSEHTPGPEWWAGQTQGNGWGVWTVNGCYSVLDHTAPGIDAKANARLIAAAPDMLALLEEIGVWLVATDLSGTVLQHFETRVGAIIAKAKGEA